jgi:hypothetical protein
LAERGALYKNRGQREKPGRRIAHSRTAAQPTATARLASDVFTGARCLQRLVKRPDNQIPWQWRACSSCKRRRPMHRHRGEGGTRGRGAEEEGRRVPLQLRRVSLAIPQHTTGQRSPCSAFWNWLGADRGRWVPLRHHAERMGARYLANWPMSNYTAGAKAVAGFDGIVAYVPGSR